MFQVERFPFKHGSGNLPEAAFISIVDIVSWSVSSKFIVAGKQAACFLLERNQLPVRSQLIQFEECFLLYEALFYFHKCDSKKTR